MDSDVERDLVRRCRRGHSAAYEPLVRHYERPAFAVARGYLGDEEDAADVVQDAFVRAYETLGRLREGSPFGPWFRTILRNLCLDRLRRVRARGRVELTAERVDRHVWSEPVPQAAAERGQLAAAVRRALADLSDEHRQVLVLKEMEELSYADIAQTLGVPAGTVASRLHHARAALKAALHARGITSEDLTR